MDNGNIKVEFHNKIVDFGINLKEKNIQYSNGRKKL